MSRKESDTTRSMMALDITIPIKPSLNKGKSVPNLPELKNNYFT